MTREPIDQETIDQAVRRHAAETPDKVAFIDPQTTLTWAELDAAADRCAGLLAAAGVGPGDRVGYLGPNAVAYPITLLGTWRRGATVVGLNFRLPSSDLAAITDAIHLAHAVVDARFAQMGDALTVRTGLTVVTPGEVWPPMGIRPVQPHVPADDDEALIYFTSGSTGYPKAVPLTHGAIEATIPYADVHHFTPESVALILTPSFHAAGATWTNYGLHIGMRHVFSNDVSPAGIASALADHGITHTVLVPTLIHAVVDELKRNPRELPSLAHIGYGASPITQQLLGEAIDVLGCEFCQVYGLSESGGGVAFLRAEEHVGAHPTKLKSAGRPGVNVDVEVRGVDGEVLGRNESGELWFRAPSLTKGYLNNPEATAKVLVDGWLNTRDTGYIDDDGYIFVQGRSDDMIKSGAEKVHPQAVEEVLITMPGIVECAVYGVPDERWGQRVTAAVVTDDEITPDDVIAYCKGKLANYEVPKSVVMFPELPRTATGKVQRAELVKLTLSAH